MPDDLDHEVIDSPEALLRHLYEAHGVAEALELDPATAPLKFWLRKHAELERAAHRDPSLPAAAPPPAPTPARAPAGPAPTAPAPGPRFRPFADPLVEAVAAALVRRGLDERQVRRGLSTYRGADGRHGEEAVRAAFVAPMLDAVAAQLPAPEPPAPGLDADFMAIADVLQRQRRSPPGTRPDDVRSSPAAPASPLDPDDDYMALADALQHRRGGGGRGEPGRFTRS